MRLDLAERLRCPRAHEPTPLIIVALRVEDRVLRAGFAGCPVCQLEARIEDAVVRFPGDGAATTAPDVVMLDPSELRVQRTAALLGLAEPGGTVLLTGRYAALAAPLAAAFGIVVVVLAADEPEAATDPTTSVFTVHAPPGVAPFTDHTFRAAALDAPFADAVRTVAIGGHILAPVAHVLPGALKEIARDEEEWLAEREPAATPVQLRRG